MANIISKSEQSIFKINRWLGVNENPDGDTQLKPGEAAEMRNFRITQDGNLQLRPGMRTIHSSRAWNGPIQGIWNGFVNGTEFTVFAADGNLWTYDFSSNLARSILRVGVHFSVAPTFFFGYSNKLYIMNGLEFLEWDGSFPPNAGAIHVVGYRPLTFISIPPSGEGTSLEHINKLCPLRRVWLSPDGVAKVFKLPEADLASIDYVKDVASGYVYSDNYYHFSLQDGSLTFYQVPSKGTNSLEVGYSHSVCFRSQVTSMRFAEMFNGGSDSRVFFFGDGSNRAIYSGLDYDGFPRADYFPDLNVLDVGSANTPITDLIRHYDRLAVFKTDSAYSVQYGTLALDDTRTAPAFFVSTANRSIGNVAPGQSQLVANSPRSLFGSAVYDWHNYSSYAANLTSDERQSKLISRKVYSTLSSMNLQNAVTFDDNERQEYYIIHNGTAVVNSYATDTWFIYSDFCISHLLAVGRSLFGTTYDGDIVSISRHFPSDNGKPINALWRSGSLSFNRDWQRKSVSRLFVTMKPEPRSSVVASFRTNNYADMLDYIVSQKLASFSSVSFRNFSFNSNRRPQTRRFKLNAKKFSYFQLVFESCTNWSTATILAANIKLRFGSNVR